MISFQTFNIDNNLLSNKRVHIYILHCQYCPSWRIFFLIQNHPFFFSKNCLQMLSAPWSLSSLPLFQVATTPSSFVPTLPLQCSVIMCIMLNLSARLSVCIFLIRLKTPWEQRLYRIDPHRSNVCCLNKFSTEYFMHSLDIWKPRFLVTLFCLVVPSFPPTYLGPDVRVNCLGFWSTHHTEHEKALVLIPPS